MKNGHAQLVEARAALIALKRANVAAHAAVKRSEEAVTLVEAAPVADRDKAVANFVAAQEGARKAIESFDAANKIAGVAEREVEQAIKAKRASLERRQRRRSLYLTAIVCLSILFTFVVCDALLLPIELKLALSACTAVLYSLTYLLVYRIMRPRNVPVELARSKPENNPSEQVTKNKRDQLAKELKERIAKQGEDRAPRVYLPSAPSASTASSTSARASSSTMSEENAKINAVNQGLKLG